jgi:hypothetical protein
MTHHLGEPVPRFTRAQLAELAANYEAGAERLRAGGDHAAADRAARRAGHYRARLAAMDAAGQDGRAERPAPSRASRAAR